MKKMMALMALLLVIGCRKQETAFPSEAKTTNAVADVQALEVANRAAGASGIATPAAPANPAFVRMIVRTADMSIVVGDTTKTVAAVTSKIEGMGGYVSGSNVWREGELLRAKLTLRVPAEKLTPALAAIRGVAKRVDNEVVKSEDVSQEYVDLESQVKNLEATEVELRELLRVARERSNKASEILEVHQQLTIIRGQIEQAKGRMRYLSQIAAMSSIDLDVRPDALTQPVVESGWQPLVVARDAVRALVGLAQSAATVAIWFLIYFVPVFGLIALIVFALWKMARRTRTSEA